MIRRTRRVFQDGRRALRAFSLVELLILVAAALVVAGLSVPVLRGIRLAANCGSALETLVALAQAENRFREAESALGPSGAPRFGTIRELMELGAVPALPVLEDARLVDGGRVLQRHGYLFQPFFTTRDEDLSEDPADSSVLGTRNGFVLYAWPLRHGVTGSSAFALDPSGALRSPPVEGALESRNLLRRYSGLEKRPERFAARRASDALSASAPSPRGAARGEDGDLWEVTPLPTGP
jgi:hypothetical protein